MAGRKRGTSLEERLAAIRITAPGEAHAPEGSSEESHAEETTEAVENSTNGNGNGATNGNGNGNGATNGHGNREASHAVEAPTEVESQIVTPEAETPAAETPASETPAPPAPAPAPPAPAPPTSQWHAAVLQPIIEEPLDELVQPEPPAKPPSLLGVASEGDTFLPMTDSAAIANRVDVGVAVQAAVRQLWTELDDAEEPVALEVAPEETPLLSKLLGRGWMSRRSSDAKSAEKQAAASEQTVGEVNELNDIIAEIAEITEVAPDDVVEDTDELLADDLVSDELGSDDELVSDDVLAEAPEAIFSSWFAVPVDQATQLDSGEFDSGELDNDEDEEIADEVDEELLDEIEVLELEDLEDLVEEPELVALLIEEDATEETEAVATADLATELEEELIAQPALEVEAIEPVVEDDVYEDEDDESELDESDFETYEIIDAPVAEMDEHETLVEALEPYFLAPVAPVAAEPVVEDLDDELEEEIEVEIEVDEPEEEVAVFADDYFAAPVFEPVVEPEVEPVVESVVESLAEPVIETEAFEPAVAEFEAIEPVSPFAFTSDTESESLVADAIEAATTEQAEDARAEANAVEDEEPTDDNPWVRRVRTERFGRIGTTLIDRGLITNEQLDEALDIQRTSGRRVGDILVELGALSAFELARVLADHMGVPFTDLRSSPPDPIIASLLPEDVARRYDALPIQRWNDQLVIAMANPTDLFALDDLQMVTRQPIIAAMAVKEDLRAAIDRVYRVSIVETVDAAKVDYTSDIDISDINALDVDEGPIVGLVNALMGQAITDHASDLHIEPCSTHIAVRFRIDGVLHDSSTIPLELLRPVVSRIKILAGLDIAQNRLAQDGRFSLTIDGRSVDVRAVTMPTSAGEAVILRLLDPIRDALGVASLGLSDAEYARFMPAFRASQGAIFIAGPTGSGKTSTIYAVLSEVNTRTKSIVSVENPVEFRLDGIKQMQINARAGLTFPTALPTVLRADPDVVFIGEVRDTDTARIAADAAITGHLVLSTLHATRAASAPMRLVEMGVEPYLVASALTLLASQRLARKLCELCAEPADLATYDRLRSLGADDSELEGAHVRIAVGCPACRNMGYVGRLPIFEIMPVTEGISRLILDRASRAQIEDLAVEEGMDTMLRAAIRRVIRGDLSVEEMLRVIS